MEHTELLKEIDSTLEWAAAVGLEQIGCPVKQTGKIIEEANELQEAVEAFYETQRYEPTKYLMLLDHVEKELGDVLVTVIIEARLLGVDIEACLKKANTKNWGRVTTGKMVDGQFVKKEDLTDE